MHTIQLPRLFLAPILLGFLGLNLIAAPGDAPIPLPEHPRPDFQRSEWVNLNGSWAFEFDADNVGEQQQWFSGSREFHDRIQVPFPWGSKLSGVSNRADIGWYQRALKVPAAWAGKRLFLVIGACDWTTRAWLDGERLGEHRGGYTPFEFELTSKVKSDQDQRLVLRADDTGHPFKLEGKQGYGPARGIWQTVYLEARGSVFVEQVQFYPDPDRGRVTLKILLSDPAPTETELWLKDKGTGFPEIRQKISAGQRDLQVETTLSPARLWTLEDPFLYELDVILNRAGKELDRVATYFGLRKIGVVNLPGSNHPYIALNNRPVYLQMTLDQSYHPEGFYTFPTDAFMRDEILRTRRLGLNSQRLHVKIDVPRKLYWADRLGVLLMADVPNSWGQPDAEMQRETEYALRQMIRRDFNHPSIFSWVVFNETWGLKTEGKGYTPDTQQWVASMFQLAKSLDPTRLVEDNSPCNYDHVQTDINSWHVYLPGYSWRDHLAMVVSNTYPGSKWNFIGGRTQDTQPLLNSECGNVWGYEGSAGDVDWSWDYHRMMNEFRRHPKVCGWLYTEHHDVINEWNGYYRFDRTDKETGLGEIVPGMTLRDLHAPIYVSAGQDLCRTVEPGERVRIPLWLSVMTDQMPSSKAQLQFHLYGWNSLGELELYPNVPPQQTVRLSPWLFESLKPVHVRAPNHPALVVLAMTLRDPGGTVLQRNFTLLRARTESLPRDEQMQVQGRRMRVLRFAPASFRSSQWSLKQWPVMNGLKMNGAGHGCFEYRVPWPKGLKPGDIAAADFRAELSAKVLHGKDRDNVGKQDGDYMRGLGTLDPSLNPNAYPMTDTTTHPSAVRVRINGHAIAVHELLDDPADHRGILSWHAQKPDRFLHEAGSYGCLVQTSLSQEVLREAAEAGEIILRLEVDAALPGGLAIYGEDFGRYPLDPSLVFLMRK